MNLNNDRKHQNIKSLEDAIEKFKNPENLVGKDAHFNASKIIDVFSGNKNEFYEAICLNSAAALIISNKYDRFEEAYEYSKKHLDSDKALAHLKKIQTF